MQSLYWYLMLRMWAQGFRVKLSDTWHELEAKIGAKQSKAKDEDEGKT